MTTNNSDPLAMPVMTYQHRYHGPDPLAMLPIKRCEIYSRPLTEAERAFRPEMPATMIPPAVRSRCDRLIAARDTTHRVMLPVSLRPFFAQP